MANPAAFRPDLAESLNNLAVLQAEMGQPAAALASIQEAVIHWKVLANSHPGAFGPDLVRALWLLGNRFVENGKLFEAREAAAEALKILAPLFSEQPHAFDRLARVIIRDYALRGRELGAEFDVSLIAPYEKLLEKGSDASETGESHD